MGGEGVDGGGGWLVEAIVESWVTSGGVWDVGVVRMLVVWT